MMVKHVVVWRFDKKEDIPTAKRLLESLQGNVPHLISLEVGENFNENPLAYDLVLITTHRDRASLQDYQDDAFHDTVRNTIKKTRHSRVFVDFEV